MKFFYPVICCAFCFFGCIQLPAQCFPDQNFSTNGSFSYTLPGSSATTYVIQIECQGADGAPALLNGNIANQGGAGAMMTAQYKLVGGDELTVFVGQAGQTGGSPSGGGGGGGSAVILNATDILIAAAAGGGGGLGGTTGIGGGGDANTNSPPQGGTGVGASGGGGFNSPGANGQGGSGGGAGTLTSMGAGGVGGVVAGMGGIGFGGGAGGAGTVGGGAGGYEGGAGGLSGPQGGMGGDSYINTGFMSNVIATVAGAAGGGAQSNGIILITCVSTGGSTQLVAMIDSIRNVMCGGGNDGVIIASATGGVPPYEYAIDGINFTSMNTFIDLAAGNHTITVMDAVGATSTVDATLTEPTPVTGSVIDLVDNVCFDGMSGSIEVSGEGGAGGYTFALDGGNFQSSGLFENLANGTFVITIMDMNNCTGDIFVDISSPDDLVVLTTAIDALCFGQSDGSIFIEVTGGSIPYQYSLDGISFQNQNNFVDLPAGPYTITVQDANGCFKEAMVTINEPDELTLTTETTAAKCGTPDGSIQASASGGVDPFVFTLNDSITSTSGSFENLLAGTYEIDVIDANGCITSTTAVVNAESGNAIVISVTDTGHLTCHQSGDGFIVAVVTGGIPPYSYTIDTTTQTHGTFDMLPAGPYTLIVADSTGCSASVLVALNEPDPLVLQIDSVVNSTCSTSSDGTISLSAIGGSHPYSFSLNDTINSSDGNFTGLPLGTYEAKVSDVNQCMASSAIQLFVGNQLTITTILTQDADCYLASTGSVLCSITGSSSNYTVILNGDTTMVMDGDSVSFGGLSAGEYTVTAIDEFGCTDTTTAIVNQPEELLLNIASFTLPADTVGGVITLNATGGIPPYEYIVDLNPIYQSSPTFSDLFAGTYIFSVRDSNNCIATTGFVISSNATVEYLNQAFNLFPNPTSDNIELRITRAIDILKITISNQIGQRIQALHFDKEQPTHDGILLNCRHFSPGVYFMNIQTTEGVAFKQFVVN